MEGDETPADIGIRFSTRFQKNLDGLGHSAIRGPSGLGPALRRLHLAGQAKIESKPSVNPISPDTFRLVT